MNRASKLSLSLLVPAAALVLTACSSGGPLSTTTLVDRLGQVDSSCETATVSKDTASYDLGGTGLTPDAIVTCGSQDSPSVTVIHFSSSTDMTSWLDSICTQATSLDETEILMGDNWMLSTADKTVSKDVSAALGGTIHTAVEACG